jgi:trehalose/maltose transport system substrate-binding protein
LAGALLTAALHGGPVAAATLKIACAAVGQELELCKAGAEAWARRAGHEVQIVTPPNDASERLALYQQVLSAGSDRIDVFQLDIIWPGLLGLHLIDLKPYAKGAEAEHFPGIVQANTVGGRLVAMPWFTNAGLLFYRKDLLDKHGARVPETWDELAATAKRIQDAERTAGNARLWGYVWQGRAYEGLTCNALEWVASHGGGNIVDSEGRVTIQNPKAEEALRAAASWVGSISPRAVLNYAEEEARGVFQSGNAVFMRNWPYAWALAQAPDSAIRGKVGVTVLPKGGSEGRHAATLGGESLAVSKYSRHAELAAEMVMYMTSAQVQKQRAIRGSFNPTLPALYKDAEVLQANPFMGELVDSFAAAVPRPATATGARYNQVSNRFWNATHEVLSGGAEPDDALGKLGRTLRRISRGGTWR